MIGSSMLDEISIRPYRPADLRALALLYQEAVRVTGALLYSEEQVRLWARHPDDRHLFGKALGVGTTLVATCGGRVASFGQLHPADHVAYLYTHPRFARRGCAFRLCAALEGEARQQGVGHVRTEASRLSRGLFDRRGYAVLEEERVELEPGVDFERFRMLKRLA